MNLRSDATKWWMVCAVGLVTSGTLQAQDKAKRYTIWDIRISDAAAAIPDEYVNHACGTNGGPPSVPIKGFPDFKKCRPDPNGLREVYFEYDDELEYQARALNNRPEIKMYAGTTVFEFPVVASVLFNDAGQVAGQRMVTDPRQQVSRNRIEFWELGSFLRQRFGEEQWTCNDLPVGEGEKPAGSMFIKNHCEKIVAGVRLILEQRYFQKKGQRFVDEQSGAAQPQAFESATRFEMFDVTLPVRQNAPNRQ